LGTARASGGRLLSRRLLLRSGPKPGVEYTVALGNDGAWSYTYPHYTYARLEPSTYNGPRELIKKGRRFRARATVTKLNGKTAILIHDVVEAI
jgi:hypothetical protein